MFRTLVPHVGIRQCSGTRITTLRLLSSMNRGTQLDLEPPLMSFRVGSLLRIGKFSDGWGTFYDSKTASRSHLSEVCKSMTGWQHLANQRRRMKHVGLATLFVSLALLIYAMNHSRPAVAFVSFSAVPVIAVKFRPLCPFCDRTLSLLWGPPNGDFCHRCGTSFVRDVEM